MRTVETAVTKSQQVKEASENPTPELTVDTAQMLSKLATEIKHGRLVPVTYNDVMNFGAQVKEAVQR
jgi:hypothetical protein